MAQTYTINGTDYTFPDVDDSDWGQNVTDWAGAVSSFLLQRSGGTFTLGAAVDFGTGYGLKIKDLESKTTNASADASAFLRMAKGDYLSWRNNAEGADLALKKNTSDLLEFATKELINEDAAQTMSSKTLTSPVINTGISGTAIDNNTSLGSSATKVPTQNAVKSYVDAQLTASDLDFSGDSGGAQSVDLDSQSLTVEGGTGVDTTGSAQKISIAIDSSVTTNSGTQALTNKTLTSPKVNEDVVMTTTSTYLNRMDATSSVQTQLNAKQATITGAATTIASSDLTASKVVQSNGSGKIEASTVSTTTLGYLDATSSIQTQLNAKQATIDSSNRLDADLIHDGSVSNTEFGYINSLSSNAQTQLDAKAPLASPYFTTYADFDSQGSAPAAPSNTGDVRLYAKDSKFYFHPQGGSATEIGSGGGVGSIDTLFTLQAKSADAPTSGSGNDAVFLGGGTLNNGGITLDTTAADLIGTDKVFKYDATGDSIRNYWYHEQSIYPGYAGKNMVLQLQYYTRNGADGESFRFVARDATMPILSVSSDGTNTITGTIDADCGTAPVVGDKIIFKDSSNNIYYRYITAIVKNSGTDGKTQNDDMTYTYSGSDVTATGKVVTGIMTDELDYLPLNDITGNEAKIYKKQMLFPDNCTTFQFGFHCLDSDTDIELFYDDIALSANQFLQTSSQGEVEYYSRNQFGGYASSYAPYLTGSYSRDTTKNVIEVLNDSTNGLKITALQRCKISCNTRFQFNTANSGHLGWTKNTAIASITTFTDKSVFVSPLGYVGSTLAQSIGVTCPVIDYVLEKGDYIRLLTDGDGFNTTDVNPRVDITATPLVNDVVLLNSQDEIFSDWQSFTPSWSSGGFGTLHEARWRRDGCEMEVFVSGITAGTTTAAIAYSELPSGYNVDISKFSSTTSTYHPVGEFGIPTINTDDTLYMAVRSDAYPNRIYFAVSSAAGYAYDTARNWNWFFSPDTKFFYRYRVPIQGWTSTFNPVLSMPLVDVGANTEYFFASKDGGSAGYGSTNGAIPYFNSVNENSVSKLGTITNTSALGTYFTASQRVKVTASYFVFPDATNYFDVGWAKNLTSTEANTSIDSTPQSKKLMQNTGQYNHYSLYRGCSTTTVLEPGDSLWPQTAKESISASVGGISIVVERDFSHTNMAHIIKPAVCILKDVKAWNSGGGTNATGSTTWNPRDLNTIEGESWFVTLADPAFTLEPGMYEIDWVAPFLQTQYNNTRLYDITNSAVTGYGSTGYSDSSSGAQVHSMGKFHITVTASTQYRIEYSCNSNAHTNYGLGLYQGFDSSTVSVYTQVKIRKLK